MESTRTLQYLERIERLLERQLSTNTPTLTPETERALNTLRWHARNCPPGSLSTSITHDAEFEKAYRLIFG